MMPERSPADLRRSHRRPLLALLLVGLVVLVPALALAEPPPKPTIVGTAEVGSTLTAETAPSESPLPAVFAWYRQNAIGEQTLIPGQTLSTYVVEQGDVGHRLVVRVVVENEVSEPSDPTDVVPDPTPPPPPPPPPPTDVEPVPDAEPPQNTTEPTVRNEARVTNVLAGTAGEWSGTPAPTLRYQWLRCHRGECDVVGGAEELRYRVRQEDEGRTLRLRVVATNTAGSASAESAPTATVTPAFVNRTPPTVTVSGPLQVGSRVAASRGTWSHPPGEVDFDYQWLRCGVSGGACEEIRRATRSTYALADADVGRSVRVRVSIRFPLLPDVRPGVETSAATGPVAPARGPLPTAGTAGATSVTATTATLLGAVDPHGTTTSWSFEYGTTDQYGSRTPEVSAGGDGAVPVQVAVSGLAPGTLYHYRLVARNASGAAEGGDATFTTAAAVGPAGVTPGPLPVAPAGAAGPPPPPPMAAVSGFTVKVDVNVVRLRWVAPAGGRRVRVWIVRRAGRKPRHVADGKVIYRGRAQAALDIPTGLRRVWYAAFVLADQGRASRPTYATVQRFRPTLLSPMEGSSRGRRVTFAWTAVRGAGYYNIQVWDRRLTRRIATRWPGGRTLKLSLRPGRYRWYVYPGHGSRARARYGALHGQGSFRVR